MENMFQIADNIHGLINCSQFEKEVISTSAFNRLHYILQNSTAYKTFPANRTTRFVHSIGVMHLSGLMFFNSFMNADNEVKQELLSRIKDELDLIILEKRDYFSETYTADIGKISENFNTEAFYNLCLCSKLNRIEELCYLIAIQAIRVSALLHDLGHPPYSHIVEYALKDLYDEIKKKDSSKLTTKEQLFLQTIEGYTGKRNDKVVIHEVVGNKIAERVMEETTKSLNDKLDASEENKAYKCYIKLVREFVKKILNSKSISDTIKEQNGNIVPLYSFFHEYLAGDIDADRLDYVVRDCTNSGVGEGRLEYGRIFSSMKIIKYDLAAYNVGDKDFIFSFDIRVKNTIEIFFRKRWEMYRDIIYHHSVRKSDSIMNSIVYMLLKESMKEGEPKAEDAEDLLIKDIDGLWKAVKINIQNEKYLTTIIQWNDNWLLSTIVGCLYHKADRQAGNQQLENLLKDYVENNKRFKSIIKRQADFSFINKNLVEKLSDNVDVRIKLGVLEGTRIGQNISKEFLEALNQKKDMSFLSSVIRPFFKLYEPNLQEDKMSYDSIIKESIADTFNELDSYNYLYTYNKPKNDDSCFVLLHDKESIKNLEEYSTVYKELKLAESTFPSFYVSICAKDSKSIKPVNKKEIYERIANNVALRITKAIDIIHKQLEI